jgi:hypothetical protein
MGSEAFRFFFVSQRLQYAAAASSPLLRMDSEAFRFFFVSQRPRYAAAASSPLAPVYTSKMLGGASQIVSKIRVKCNGT